MKDSRSTSSDSALLQEISLREIPGLHIGHASNYEAMTGVTVLLFENGVKAGVDVSGGGPASRETRLCEPLTADNPINAIVLSGGSAYGLAAGGGVMRWLEEHGFGYDTGFARVPLVCQSCIYDLSVGSADVRPDAKMGYLACEAAWTIRNKKVDASYPGDACGRIGAGCGASVGKICGMERASDSGLGVHAVKLGNLVMAAIVVVNALGDVYDPDSGKIIAGLHTEDGSGFADSCQELYKLAAPTDLFTGNTTIGAIITNGKFQKAELSKIASMARCAYARCIRPVGTMADGDTIYAASSCEVEADINVAGTLAAQVMAEAIKKAVCL